MTLDEPEYDERMESAVKQALPPIDHHPRAILQHDLWPAMQYRMEQRSFAVPWFDWALLAVLVLWIALFPRAIPILLYHL